MSEQSQTTLANANELISSLAAENETLGREIERLRAALRELLAVMPVLPAAAASIVGMRERYAVAIEEARRAAR